MANGKATLDELPRGCFDCRYFRRETESWEMPHVWWYECRARHANESLRGFPWKLTKCKLRALPDGALKEG
jgi:hypothetical protein